MVMMSTAFGDPNNPKTIPISTFCVDCVAFRIFIVGERRDIKFGRQIDRSKSQPMDDKSSPKWAWWRHVTHFKFVGPNRNSGMAEARVVKFCTQVGHIKRDDISPQKGRSYGHLTTLNIQCL